MTPSVAHEAARTAAARLAALTASYDLLTVGSRLELLDAETDVVAEIDLQNPPAVLDEEALTITLNVPAEGVRVEADTITAARVIDGADQLWADLTVSETAASPAGDLTMDTLTHDTGTFIILTSAVFQG